MDRSRRRLGAGAALLVAALALAAFALAHSAALVLLSAGALEVAGLAVLAAEFRESSARTIGLRQEADERLAARRAAEELERAARRQFEAILQNVGDGVTAQAPDGTLLFANEEAVRLTGFATADAMRSAMPVQRLEDFEILGEDGTPFPVDDLPGRMAIRTGARQERRLRFRVKSTGEERASIVRAVPVIGDDGAPLMVINVFHDVTEEIRHAEARERLLLAERRAHASAEEARSRAAFLAEAGAILASSLDVHTTLRSLARLAIPRFGDWCGVDLLEEGTPRNLAVAHVDPEKVDLALELLSRFPQQADARHGTPAVLRTGQPDVLNGMTDEMFAVGARSPEHLELLRKLSLRSFMSAPLKSRGRVAGVLTVASSDPARVYGADDVEFLEEIARRASTAIEHAELFAEAQEANRAKDEFLATLSHELRTPLHAILGWARMLRTAALSDATRARALESIERNAQVQTQLVDDLLDVSRIITGKLRIEAEPADVGRVVEAALDSVRAGAEAKQITIALDVERDGAVVRGDVDRLQQIAWNLVSNAIKFTPAGGRVSVRVSREGDDVLLEVADDGRGIDSSFLPYVFDRFRQADGSTTREFGGLGLGLAIVRHLVELHGGHVEAHSEGRGKGARFRVRLPAARGVRASEAAPFPVRDARPLEGVSVLVVDDEGDSVELLRSALESAGARVDGATSAAEALERLARSMPDVVVSDIGMPGEDGYALLARVRASHRTMPVIALTAYAGPEDRQRARAAGFARHLAKPVDPRELAGVVAAVISE